MTKEEQIEYWKQNGVEPVVAEAKEEEGPATTLQPSEAASVENASIVQAEVPKELSDADLLDLIQKRGLKLPVEKEKTEEERKAEESKRKSDARAWGLSAGKFKLEEYEELTKSEERKIDLLVDEFTQELKKNNPEMDEDSIQDLVATYTYSNLEDTDPVKIKRQKELVELASVRLKNKFKSIYSIDAEFNIHQAEQERLTSENRRIEAAIPVYQSDVQKVLEDFKKGEAILIEDSSNPEDAVTVNLSYSDEDLREIENHFLKAESAIDCVRKGYTLADLKEGVETVLLKKHFKRLVSKTAKEYNSIQKEKYLRGEKGIVPNRSLSGSSSEGKSQIDAYIAQQVQSGQN